MKNKLHTPTFLVALVVGAGSANATLLSWQSLVTGSGTTPAATHFTVVDGTAPEDINVGALSDARSFEFIVNAGDGGVSQALLGDRNGNNQALKFEQWNNLGSFGITDFGVADHDSGLPHITGTDIHVVFAFDGFDTFLYVNGVASPNGPLPALNITGQTGIGAAAQAGGGFFDNLDGQILGFASYDSALDATEIQVLSAGFFAPIPEPSSSALLGLGGLALILRRRR